MIALALVAALLVSAPVAAQELAPRAYWPAPVGTNILVLGYQRSVGDILVDPSLPITGVESGINYFQVSYQRSLSLFGRSASAQLGLPYADGRTEGEVEGEYRVREVTGFSDARFRLAINLLGAPALDGVAFQALRAAPRPLVGVSLTVQAPTGDYDPEKLYNIGTNRWSLKPEVGTILPLARTWLLEASAGAWFFTDNDEFNGQTRSQDPISAVAVHLIKRFKPGLWASLDGTFYAGGETRVGDELRDDLQRNSRAGFTVVVPLGVGHALRGGFSVGVATRSGGDFELYSLSYAYAW